METVKGSAATVMIHNIIFNKMIMSSDSENLEKSLCIMDKAEIK